MTREEAAKLLPIIKAFVEGKQIQCKVSDGKGGEWVNTFHPTFDVENFDYRIKPESKYRPFKNAEECWNEMLKHQPFGWVKEKCGIYTNVIIVNPDEASVTTGISDFHSFGDMLKDYTFTDGTPFGIKEE